MRFFNTAGVCFPDRHYMLPPEPRLPGARQLIDEWKYFIVHAPRQTGKTTTLETLGRNLTAEGRHVALRVSCERAGEVGDNLAAASAEILEAIRRAADQQLPGRFRPPVPWPDAPPGSLVFSALQDWAVACPLPLVLLFDEIDSLHGFVLRSVLRQIRDGHTYRAHAFPAAVVLCGMRDIRDYKAAAGGDPSQLGSASPFNVAVKSIRIGDFTLDEVAALYAQHRPDPLAAGLAQLDRYLTRLKLDTGTLVIFDRRPGIPPAADRTRITREQTPEGRTITLMRA